MNVYTYFETVPGISPDDSIRLIQLWKRNWQSKGFTPVVLNESHAREHPRFAEFDDRIKKFPTINAKEYERNCFLRYLAVGAIGGGIMADYDVFCYEPYDFPNDASMPRTLISLQRHVPSVIYGSEAAFNQAIAEFYKYEATSKDVSDAGIPHVSDMYIILRAIEFPFEPRHVVKNYGEEGWQQAPFVHFSNGAMRNIAPRWKHIQQLRNWA